MARDDVAEMLDRVALPSGRRVDRVQPSRDVPKLCLTRERDAHKALRVRPRKVTDVVEDSVESLRHAAPPLVDAPSR